MCNPTGNRRPASWPATIYFLVRKETVFRKDPLATGLYKIKKPHIAVRLVGAHGLEPRTLCL